MISASARSEEVSYADGHSSRHTSVALVCLSAGYGSVRMFFPAGTSTRIKIDMVTVSIGRFSWHSSAHQD